MSEMSRMSDFISMKAVVEALKENMGREFLRERTRNGKTYYVWQASYEEVCEFLDDNSDAIVAAIQDALNHVIEQHMENGVVELVPPDVVKEELGSLIESVKKNSLADEGIIMYEKELKTHKIIIGILIATIITMFLMVI